MSKDRIYRDVLLLQLSKESEGKEIKTDSGEVIGVVEHSWVEDGRVFAKIQIATDSTIARIA